MLNFILNGTKVVQFSNLKEMNYTQSIAIAGAGGETRTPNIQIRSLTLYPVELRPHTETRREDFIEKLLAKEETGASEGA